MKSLRNLVEIKSIARPIAISLLLLGVTLSVFWQVRGHQFVLIDDDIHLYENAGLNPPSLEGWIRFWKKPTLGLYVPVTYSAWTAVTAATGGKAADHPAAFHEMNLWLHALSAVLVFLILRCVLEGAAQRDWAALAGALLYALHPVQVEPVAWASGAKDLLAGVLGWSALLAWLKKRDRSATALFAFALLAKPSAVVLPAMAFLLGRDPWRERAKRLVPWALLCVPIFIVTKLSQPDHAIAYIAAWWKRPLLAADSLSFYLAKIGFPLFLVPDYSRTPQVVLAQKTAALSLLVPLVLAWLCRRKAPWLLVPFALLAVGVFPVMGWLPFYFQIFSGVADRFLYLAMIGPALALSLWLTRKSGWKRWSVAIAGLLFLADLSFVQARHWKDTPHLLAYTLQVNPKSVLAHNNFGAWLENRGDLKDALGHYEATLELRPDDLPPQYNAARVLGRLGRFAEAEVRFEKVLKKNPFIPEAHYSLGLIDAHWGRLEKAQREFNEAARLAPKMAKAHFQLGNIYNAEGKIDEAKRAYDRALRLQPSLAEARRALDGLGAVHD